MQNKKSFIGKIICCVLAVAMLASFGVVSVFASTTLEEGNYTVDATLSCYVNAMGGVEFSDGYGLLTGSAVTVDADGNAKATLTLGKTSGLAIYGVSCTAFIGTDEAPGYYADGAVTKEGVTYTVSEDTATNANGEVNYINSITMPVSADTSEYTMWLYLDSNVMGCQLGDGNGTGSSNTPGVATAHTAKLTIDWTTAEKVVEADATSNQSANVEYAVESGYEVEIPATITVDSATKKGAYEVVAKNFVIGDSAYVTVTASEGGVLTNGTDELAFTNTLAEGSLKVTGDKLTGEVEVTDNASNPGNYTGTVDFTIEYFKGE